MKPLGGGLLDRSRALEIFTLVLLLGAFSSVSAGVAVFAANFEPFDMFPVVVLAVLTGWAAGRQPNAWRRRGLAAALLGLSIAMLSAGRLFPLFGNLARGIREAAGKVLLGPASLSSQLPALTAELRMIGISAGAMAARTADWLQAWFSSEGPIYDPAASTFFWALVLWSAACWAAWITRVLDNPLLGLAPGGVVLGLGLSYTFAEPQVLFYFLGALLFLIVISRLTALERSWTVLRLDFPEDLALDHFATGLGLTVLLLALSLIIPSVSVRPIMSAAARMSRDLMAETLHFAAAVGLQESESNGLAAGGIRFAGMPRDHLIGTGPDLKEIEVMSIQVEDSAPGRFPVASLGYYWRGVTYDLYSGRGWASAPTENEHFLPGEQLPGDALPGQAVIRQDVRYAADFGGTMHVAGQLVSADRAVDVAWRQPAVPGLLSDRRAGSGLGDIFGVSVAEMTYTAESRIAWPGQVLLRQASNDYPDEVIDRYLQLPATLPGRVVELAAELTVGAPTAYDKALGIETFLRRYPYTLDLPAPPPGRDVVDYFLFDLKQGYCDYYASSMVVLARAAGLPARLVVGYGSGTYDLEGQLYRVSAADAHSWVEIYFPAYGWIEFEPTGNRPLFERPANPPLQASGDDSVPLDEPDLGNGLHLGPRVGRRLRAGIIGLTGLAVFAVLVWWGWPRWLGLWLHNKSPDSAMDLIFQQLYRSGRRLDIAIEPGFTALEIASQLADQLETANTGGLFRPPDGGWAGRIAWLADLHGRALFSPHAVARAEQGAAVQTWGRLVRMLWLLRLLRLLQSIGPLAGLLGSRSAGIDQDWISSKDRR